jgi:hypothetical protein
MTWVGHLISFAVILQSIEFFWIPAWRWQTLAPDFPKVLAPVLRSHQLLNVLRLVAAILAMYSPIPAALALMVVTTWLINVRWRGTFNGGSDFMTFHILLAWFIASVAPGFEKACLLYIAIQVILSYFVAGIAKLRNPEWRSGHALETFLNRVDIMPPKNVCFILSWVLMVFEVLFPLALKMPLPFVVMAIFFHLTNVYVFGLNRFFFAWLAGYPALFLIAMWL